SLIRALGDENVLVRQDARKALVALGALALPELLAASSRLGQASVGDDARLILLATGPVVIRSIKNSRINYLTTDEIGRLADRIRWSQEQRTFFEELPRRIGSREDLLSGGLYFTGATNALEFVCEIDVPRAIARLRSGLLSKESNAILDGKARTVKTIVFHM